MKQILILLALSAGLFSCTRQGEILPGSGQSGDDAVPVRITGMIGGGTATKVSGTSWDQGDNVGIYMKRSGEVLSGGSVIAGADNVHYTVTDAASGTLTASGNAVYYPREGDVDFIAYYPYRSNLSGYIYPVNIVLQNSSSLTKRADLLYSDNLTGQNRTNPAVGVVFRHVMSRLVMNVSMGTGYDKTDISVTNPYVQGFYTQADFSLVDGSFSNQRAVTSVFPTIEVVSQTAGTAYIELFLIPTSASVETNRQVQFLVFPESGNNSTVTWVIDPGVLFESGKSYTYNVTLNLTATRSSGADVGFAEDELVSVSDIE